MHYQQQLTTIVTSTSLDILILGWIDSKFHRTMSVKTRTAYTDTLCQFRDALKQQGLDLDCQDNQALEKIVLTAQVFSNFSARGKAVASSTKNQRLAILSSFYEYAKRQAVLTVNPIERVERAKVQQYGQSQPLTNDQTATALAAIDRNSLQGKRDYALLSLLLQTGRRLAEVEALEVRNLALKSSKITVTFERCKGNKTMYDTLSYSVTVAIMDWLTAFYGDQFRPGGSNDTRPVWAVLTNRKHKGGETRVGAKLGWQSISLICEKYLGTSKVHTTRHTWAHTMDKLGASAATIQARLGHESLATTGRYLAQLSSAENEKAEELSARLGIR